MPHPTTLRVFVASPGDVKAERDALAKLVAEINQTIAAVAPEKQVALEVIRWETHAVPAAGRPQGVINEQLGDFDIFIGIMWSRFGTPSGQAQSGTEEEFNLAYDNWHAHGRPQLMFYFSQAPFSPPTQVQAVEQLLKVAQFRQRLSELALVWEYRGASEFADTVRPHLLKVLAQAIDADQPAVLAADAVHAVPAAPVERRVPAADTQYAMDQLHQLATDYTELRARMESGDARTRQMELIVSKMRSHAVAAMPELHRLAQAEAPGERLAAIAALQVQPQADYIDWLGTQCVEQKPFVAYHAAMALLTAARSSTAETAARLQQAIDQGLRALAGRPDTDRARALHSAQAELQRHLAARR